MEAGAVVGDEVTIKNGVAVWQYVTVKNRVFLGPNCSLTNDNRPRSKRDWTPVATTIREGATIGANATIVCGCHIGRYAFVGAGAVVTKPVPDYAVVLGNPARVRGYVCECCQPLAGKGAVLTCKKCGLRYSKTKQGVRCAAAAAAVAVSPKPKAKARRSRSRRRRRRKRGEGGQEAAVTAKRPALRVMAASIAHNEASKIGSVLDRFEPGLVDRIVVVDDASTDETPEVHPVEGRGGADASRAVRGRARPSGRR